MRESVCQYRKVCKWSRPANPARLFGVRRHDVAFFFAFSLSLAEILKERSGIEPPHSKELDLIEPACASSEMPRPYLGSPQSETDPDGWRPAASRVPWVAGQLRKGDG